MNPVKPKKEIDASKVGCTKDARATAVGILARINEHHDRTMPEFTSSTISHWGMIEGYIDCAIESGDLVSVTVHIVERSGSGTPRTLKLPVTLDATSKDNPFRKEVLSEQTTQQDTNQVNSQSKPAKSASSTAPKTDTKPVIALQGSSARSPQTVTSNTLEEANVKQPSQTLL